MNPIDPIIEKLDALWADLGKSTITIPDLVDALGDLEDEMAAARETLLLDALEARAEGASPDGGSQS